MAGRIQIKWFNCKNHFKKLSDSRYDKISELFVQFSNGNFDYRIELSEKLDEVDAFISSINMLGEELKEITISKEFFNNVFNSVSDLIFVLAIDGTIKSVNKAIFHKIGFTETELNGVNIDVLFDHNDKSFFQYSVNKVNKQGRNLEFNSTFYYNKKNYPSLCTFNKLYSNLDEHIGYTLIVKDLSNLKKAEDMVKQSEEKYRNLFEESGEAILIVDFKGRITEINSAAKLLLGVSDSETKLNNFFDYIKYTLESKNLKKAITEKKSIHNVQLDVINNVNGLISNCLATATCITSLHLFQILLKDLTYERQIENLMMRTIINTQENERVRFSQDIHDGLGQQLSAIKFYLSTLSSSKQLNDKSQQLIEKSEIGLNRILANLREICFNLMPKTIENFGLIAAVNELSKNIEVDGKLRFHISAEMDFPRLTFDKEIGIFRIIQEFINNSIKHSASTEINIIFRFNDNEVFVTLKDNGKGFDLEILRNPVGMGLRNVTSRARSHNGNLKITSASGSGTKYELSIPILKKDFQQINKN